MELILTVIDVVLNVFTLGWWGRSQGERNSGVYYIHNEED